MSRRLGLRAGIAAPVALLFVLLSLLVVVEALGDTVFSAVGSSTVIDVYLFEAAAAFAGVLMVLRGIRIPDGRPWIVLGSGTLVWVGGLVLTDFPDPYAFQVVSEVLVLAWYPLAVFALLILFGPRLRRADVPDWIDGIAVAVAVATPLLAVLQRAYDKSHVSGLAYVQGIAYPALDIAVLGVALGMIGVAAWRLPRPWYLLALGILMWVVADSLWSANGAEIGLTSGFYYFLWPSGLLLIAVAAWQPWSQKEADHPKGWRLLLLPLGIQVFAIATQVWALAGGLGELERIMTILLLTVVIVQILIRYQQRALAQEDGKKEEQRVKVNATQRPG